MTVRLAINGFGRTGRSFLRAALAHSDDFEIVAINDLGSPDALARLFARDSVHGRYPELVNVESNTMIVGERRIKMLAESEAKVLPWQEFAIDVVVDREQYIVMFVFDQSCVLLDRGRRRRRKSRRHGRGDPAGGADRPHRRWQDICIADRRGHPHSHRRNRRGRGLTASF